MDKLAIYCAGGLGQDVLSMAEMELKDEWSEIIFVDDVTEEKTIAGKKVLTFEEFLSSAYVNENVQFVIANGEPQNRKKIFEKIEAHNLSMGVLTAKSSIIPETVIIGSGSIVNFQTIVSTFSTVGINTFIGKQAMIGHHVKIGNHSVINSCTYMGGWCEVGDYTFIGAGATIRDKVKIGNNCIIGIGSVVTKDVEDNMVVVGNPAKLIRMNDFSSIFKKKGEK